MFLLKLHSIQGRCIQRCSCTYFCTSVKTANSFIVENKDLKTDQAVKSQQGAPNTRQLGLDKMHSLYSTRLMYGGLKILQVHFISETNHVEVKEKKSCISMQCFCPLSLYPQSPVSAHVFLDTSLSSIATSRSLLWALCGLCCLMKSWSHSLIDIHNEIQPDVWPSPHMNLVYDQLITKHILQRDPKLCAKNSNSQVRAPQMSSAC